MDVVLRQRHLIQYQIRKLPMDDIEQRIGQFGNLNTLVYRPHPDVGVVPGQHAQAVQQHEMRGWFGNIVVCSQ